MRTFTQVTAGAMVISAVLISACAIKEEAKTPAGDLVQNSPLERKVVECLPGFDDAVADSLTGFGGTQGGSGWQYGYMRREDLQAGDGAAAGSRHMERYEGGWWRLGDSAFPAISATTFEASPGLIPVRRWTPSAKGSIRLVGHVQEPSPGREGEFRVLLDGREIWSRQLGREDSIRHGFDVLALDLAEESAVDFLAVSGQDSPRVQVNAALQIVPEPHTTRWRADLPTGFPAFTERGKEALRRRGQEILQRIRDASAGGRGRIVIPPGPYLFHAHWSHASTVRGLANMEIAADGVTFWFEPPMVHALLFENCRNVTVRGLTIDFTIPCWFQARVTEIDRQGKTIQADLMQGYEPRNARGERETEGDRAFLFYDAEGRFINHGPSPGKWRLSDDRTSVLCRDIQRWGIPDALQVGDYVVGTIRTGAAPLAGPSCRRGLPGHPGRPEETGRSGGNVGEEVVM